MTSKFLVKAFNILMVGLAAIGLETMFSSMMNGESNPQAKSSPVAQVEQDPTMTATATETLLPSTPLPTVTPRNTLIPPPTFEPPTLTPLPSAVPSITPTATTNVSVSIPGLNGAETATPSSTPSCVPNEDWQLTYTVQFDDALATIAAKYNTTMFDLAWGNCLENMDLIVVGQVLRVPGDAPPAQPAVECSPFELLTPINGAVTIAGDGQLTFNWRGPQAPKNLIRIYRPDETTVEYLVELRQNETINMSQDLGMGGTYTWEVVPLGNDFVQICPRGGPWTFTKDAAGTP